MEARDGCWVVHGPWHSSCIFSLSQALVRWGGALLELAHLKQGSESTDMIHQVRARCFGRLADDDLLAAPH